MYQDTNNIKLELTLAFRKVDKTDIADQLISFWTKSKYVHVELIMDNMWISSNLKGVHIKELTPLKDTYDYHNLEVIITHDQYVNIVKWIYKQNGKTYDRLGIYLSQFIPLRIDNRNKWFCSELVTKILQMLNVVEVQDNYPFLTSPADLARTFKVE